MQTKLCLTQKWMLVNFLKLDIFLLRLAWTDCIIQYPNIFFSWLKMLSARICCFSNMFELGKYFFVGKNLLIAVSIIIRTNYKQCVFRSSVKYFFVSSVNKRWFISYRSRSFREDGIIRWTYWILVKVIKLS